MMKSEQTERAADDTRLTDDRLKEKQGKNNIRLAIIFSVIVLIWYFLSMVVIWKQ